MAFLTDLQQAIQAYFKECHDLDVKEDQLIVNPTRAEFVGDYSVVVFPFVKQLRKAPAVLATDLGDHLVTKMSQVIGYNVIKGFLNLELSDSYWSEMLLEGISLDATIEDAPSVLVEFCSPNTNKPLHLGHVRNILLGWSVSRLYEVTGHRVVKVQIINDRGISISQSMLAWKLTGEGDTPQASGEKGDHLVGKYYVTFNQLLRREYDDWKTSEIGKRTYTEQSLAEESESDFYNRYDETYLNKYSELGRQARELLLKWEANDPEVRQLWAEMNSWVYDGFAKTYEALDIQFDQLYYESETYLLGKKMVEEGLQKGVFYKIEDGSVWVDLTEEGLDEKLVLRSDGTSVYITQDLGTASKRYQDHGTPLMIYTVGNEQDYHFQVLFNILKKLEEPYADGLYHLSYGMISLPDGRMKSREGTVVDADDLIAEVIAEATAAVEERGALTELSQEERQEVIRRVALAALKFFIIKVQPRKGMIFDPKDSVDLQGQTGPYIQYAYVRIQSVLRRAQEAGINLQSFQGVEIGTSERTILRDLAAYSSLVQQAAKDKDPSQIANYCYALAKSYNKLWNELPIFNAEGVDQAFRLSLSKKVGEVLQHGMDILGIQMPAKM